MAGFTQNTPREYTPYISQIPMDAFLKVGMAKEENYIQAVSKLQSQVDAVGNLDIARPQDKAYLNQKVNDLVGKINQAAGSEVSNPMIFNQLTSMAATVGNDQNILAAVSGTQQLRAKQAQIKELKEKHPELYSANNEAVAMMDINKWLSDGSPVGTKLNDRRQFTPWYDATKETEELTKDFLSRPDEFTTETVDANGVVKKTTYKGKTADQISNFLRANLSDKARNQFVIDGTANGMNLSDDVFIQEYQRDKESQIKSLQDDYDKISQAYYSSTATPEERTKHSLNLRDINSKIDELNKDKSNVDYMRAALAQKPDYYGQMYANQKINTMGATRAFSSNSLTYGSNEATVAQLNRIATRQNMMYTQAQENARASMVNQLGYAKLRHDIEHDNMQDHFKAIELGLKYPNGSTAGKFDPSTPGSYDLKAPDSQNQTTQATGANAYQGFKNETFDKINQYSQQKMNLFNDLSKDHSFQQTLANGAGKSWNQMSSAERLRSFDNYITQKNSEWEKGTNVPEKLSNFFANSTDLLRDVTVRRAFGNAANEQVLKNMGNLGIGQLTIDGNVYTPKDILEYVTTGRGKIANVKFDVQGGFSKSASNPYGGYTPVSNKYEALAKAIDKFKGSAALQEYYNKFNYSTGQESHRITRSFDPKNKKEEQDFSDQKGYIMGLINAQQGANTVPNINKVNVAEMSPVFHINLDDGSITGSFISKGKNNSEIQTPFTVKSDQMKLNNSRDLQLQKEMSMNGGATGPILVRGLKPFKVVVKSNSTDAASKYTVGPGLSAATYNIYDETGNQIQTPNGGFQSPSAAEDWIRVMGDKLIGQQASKWYSDMSKNPKFQSLSREEKSALLKKSFETYDPLYHMQTISNNVYDQLLQSVENKK